MALSQRDALALIRDIMNGPRAAEMARLQRIADAMKPAPHRDEPFVPTVTVPDMAPARMKETARKAKTNYLPLVVDTFGQVMKVDGYESKSDPDRQAPWYWWQRNRMDARQTGLVRSALQYGTAYAQGLPGSLGRDVGAPRIDCFSPRRVTALYQNDDDEWPQQYIVVTRDHVTLVDEELQYITGIERYARSLLAEPSWAGQVTDGWLTFIETREHGIGVPPLVRYRDRMLLDGEEQLGIVEPLMIVQERLDEIQFQSDQAAYVQAFKQRYVLGWVPRDEREELKMHASNMWYFEDSKEHISIGELESADGKWFSDKSVEAKRDIAAIGQLPAQVMGIDGISNISDATLAGLESAKSRKAGEITTSLGESHEQLMRLVAFIDGNVSAADDYDAEIRWRNFEARSFAQVVDGLSKLVQSLGLDPAIALEDVPGFTGQKLDRAKVAMRRAQARQTIAAMSSQPPAPPVDTRPQVTDAGAGG